MRLGAPTRATRSICSWDWRMPGLDGVETARRIRADSSLKRIPAIVIVTAFGREEVHREAGPVLARAMVDNTLLALAFDHAVAHQAIEPRAGLSLPM